MAFEMNDGQAEGYVHKQGFTLEASPFKTDVKSGEKASFQMRSFGKNFTVTFGPGNDEAIVLMDDCKFGITRD